MELQRFFLKAVLSVMMFLISAPVLTGSVKGNKSAGNPATSQQAAKTAVPEYVPNVVVVKLQQPVTVAALSAVTGIASLDQSLKALNVLALEPVLKHEKILGPVRAQAFQGLRQIYYAHFSGSASPVAVAQTLNQNPNVVYAEPKYVSRVFATPNDPQFDQQNNMKVIKAVQAWDTVKGEQGNVVIAIVDGGTDIDHPDLSDNLWVNPGEIPGNGIDDDGNGFVDDVHGWNFASNSSDPSGLPNTPSLANHGSHTAGIACAVTHNGIGVAGASWNARLMPINAASPTDDNVIAFWEDGALYAAANGADIISLSLGRLGPRSSFEQEVINSAAEMGVAVVAAAGNDGTSALHLPAGYDHVLAVANTTDLDIKDFSSNYGPWVDVAAPGDNVQSTTNNSTYGSISGTSMSCPLVAGVIGLVKTQHPEWSGIQAAEQVRVTADNIDALNPFYAGGLGKGRVNAMRAVTESSPSVRIRSLSFTDGNNSGVIEPGESVSVTLTMINYLLPASNVSLALTTDDNFVTLTKSSGSIATIGTLEEKTLSAVFSFTVSTNAPSGHPIDFALSLDSGNYHDVDRFVLTILPTFGTADVNNIDVTVTNIGRIGFANSASSENGIGFRFANGPNLLFEGAMIAGVSPTRVSSAARGLVFGNNQQFDQDFTIAEGGDLQVVSPGNFSDQESIGIFEDAGADNPMNVRIVQQTFAMGNPPFDDMVIFRYLIENQNSSDLDNFHLGLFFDWDIDGGNFATNVADYDASRKLGYAFDTGSGPPTYVGISVLTAGGVHYRAIYNDPDLSPTWGLHDGYTDEEKWESISGGLTVTQAGPADISNVIATGPFTIKPGEELEVAFALLAGSNLSDLQSNADAAKQLWKDLFVTGVAEDHLAGPPSEFALQQNYPNPFNPGTVIRYQIPKASEVEIAIYNSLGQIIKTLVNARQSAGAYSVQWDGTDERGNRVASGVYLYRIQAGQFTRVRKLIFMK